MNDEFDDVPSRRSVSFPMTVKIAGVIWIAFGGLILVNAIINLAMTVGGAAAAGGGNAGPAAVGGTCGSALPVLFGLVFVVVGIQSVRGTVRDTLGNGIGSIIFGLLCGGTGALAMLGGAALTGQGGQEAAMGPIAIIAGVINVISGIGLLIAGALALMGRSDYKAWQAANRR